MMRRKGDNKFLVRHEVRGGCMGDPLSVCTGWSSGGVQDRILSELPDGVECSDSSDWDECFWICPLDDDAAEGVVTVVLEFLPGYCGA